MAWIQTKHAKIIENHNKPGLPNLNANTLYLRLKGYV